MPDLQSGTTGLLYRWSNSMKVTKYCYNMQRGYDGFTDNLMTLESLDDVATVVLGNGARMSTAGDWQELIENTKQK